MSDGIKVNLIKKGKEVYQETEGIVIGDDFLDKIQFKKVLKKLAKDSSRWDKIQAYLDKLSHTIITLKVNNERARITNIWESDVEKIADVVDNIQKLVFATGPGKNLGGKISVMTSFNFGDKTQETYLIGDEADFYDTINKEGNHLAQNTLSIAQSLQSIGKASKQQKNFEEHLTQYYNEIIDNTLYSDPKDREQVYNWAYYNARKRFYLNNSKTHRSMRRHGDLSLATYLLGENKNRFGLIYESFITHWKIYHPNTIKKIIKTPIYREMDGITSYSYLSLLNSSKGNIGSLYGGDNIIVNNRNQITTNIQAKASLTNSYEVIQAANQYLNNIQFLVNKMKSIMKPNNISDQDVEKIFNKFKNTAWKKVNKKMQENLEKELDNKVYDELFL